MFIPFAPKASLIIIEMLYGVTLWVASLTKHHTVICFYFINGIAQNFVFKSFFTLWS